MSDEPKPEIMIVNGQAYQRVETPEPWKTALALVLEGKVAAAHALIEREVPEDAEVPDTRNVMRVMVAFALWQGRGSPPDAS